MRSYVVPVLLRFAVLNVIPWAFFTLVESDPDFHWLVTLVWTMALVPAVWAAADGVRSARRGAPARVGLVVWLLVAVATGVTQVLLPRLASGAPLFQLGLGPYVRNMAFWALLVGVPALLAFAATFGIARTVVSRRG